MVWVKGQTGNPNGRPRKYPEPPPGMNLRDYYLREELHRALAQGHKDPLRFQLEKMQDEALPVGLRCAIANNITPYYHPRLGIASSPKFIEVIVEVPNFQTVEEAESFLAKLSVLAGAGELSPQSALDLSTLVRNWISAKHQAAEIEIKRANAGQDSGDQIIKIEGGLPSLPGTNITMPDANGNNVLEGENNNVLEGNGHAIPRTIEHSLELSQIESTPEDPAPDAKS